jgi:hypothetical protein
MRRIKTAAYAIQVGGDVAVGVDDGLLAPQLDDFADDYHTFAHIRVEVWAGDARVGDCLHDWTSFGFRFSLSFLRAV